VTAEYIIRAAIASMIRGHHKPYCWRAHVPGCGHISEGLGPIEDRADYLRQLERSATSELENMTYAQEYAEPGYAQPEKGILFADWNVFPRGLDTILERYGYAIEWSDEWSMCEDCGRAFRTSPDSYSWQPSHIWEGECSLVCLDCADYPAYLESLENDPDACCMRSCDPSDYGYERLSDSKEYENGFFPGQHDNPADILKALHAKGYRRIVFRLAKTSQFYVKFETWRKIETEDSDNE
jgi:hypothetical protein